MDTYRYLALKIFFNHNGLTIDLLMIRIVKITTSNLPRQKKNKLHFIRISPRGAN